MKFRKIMLLTIAVLLSTEALAGATFVNLVSITTTNFRGGLAAARFSADPTQYIGCYISTTGAAASVVCQARDAAGTFVSCVQSAPSVAMLNAVATLSDAAFVNVTYSGTTCTSILSHANSAFIQ